MTYSILIKRETPNNNERKIVQIVVVDFSLIYHGLDIITMTNAD